MDEKKLLQVLAEQKEEITVRRNSWVSRSEAWANLDWTGAGALINPDGRWIKHQFDWTNDEIEEFFNKNMEKFAQEFDLRFQAN